MTRPLRVTCLLVVWGLAACVPSLPAPAPPPAPLVLVTLDPHATSTPTPFQPLTLSEVPPPTETYTPTETPPPSPTATFTLPAPTEPPTVEPARPPPAPAPVNARTHYSLRASLDYSGNSLEVDENILYTNNTSGDLSSIVLAVEPNHWSNCISIVSVGLDGAAGSNYNLDGHRMELVLSQPLTPGSAVTIVITYKLTLPYKRHEDTFGYLANQDNLTDWFPFVVPYIPGQGWLLHERGPFGEHLVYDAADFDVDLNAGDPAVVLAASAPGEPNGDWTHYHLEAARTFVFSASDQYKVKETAVGAAVIRSYTFAGHENAADGVLWMATQSLGLYGVKFAPYPYPSLSIVETDLADGQEYDGLVFLSSKFFTDYNGTARSNLITIGTHEIAHQWWFGLVGSDQAIEPWLDEALAVYSEKIFYEYNYPRYGDWWWSFRVNYFGPSGWVDASIYDNSTFRLYTNAAYLNGANFLDDLRTRIGDEAFFALLQDYAARYAHRRASARDFFAVLVQHSSVNYSDIVSSYFQQPH